MLSTIRIATRRPFLSLALVLSAAYVLRPPRIATLGSKLSKSSSSSARMDNKDREISKTEEEWQAQLSPEQFRILRKQGTEMAGTGEYDGFHPDSGTFNCAACDTPLYTAKHKFKSGCGWPAFFDAIPGRIERHVDNSWGMQRIEIVCKACGGHLGHVFKGEHYKHANGDPIEERHCVNSVSLRFDDEDLKTSSKDANKAVPNGDASSVQAKA